VNCGDEWRSRGLWWRGSRVKVLPRRFHIHSAVQPGVKTGEERVGVVDRNDSLDILSIWYQ
jgi:hypothetical protein